MTSRERLRRQIVGHLAGLSRDETEAWLDRHGPPALGEEESRSVLSPVQHALLSRHRQKTLAANLYRIGRFQDMVDCLSEAGIPVCPLKGIHLLGTVYRDDPEHRPMADLDLLVRPEDAEAAVGRLEERLGLRETALSRSLAPQSHERVLLHRGLVVEIHVRLGLRTGASAAWETLGPSRVRLLDREVYVLDRETTLAYLLAHFVLHIPWSRLARVEDVLRWDEEGFDAETTMERAHGLRIRRLVVAAVRSLRSELGPEALAGLSDRDSGWGRPLLSLYETFVPAGWAASRSEGSRLQRHLGTVLLADRAGDLVSFLKKRVPIRQDFARTNDC